MRLGIDRVPHRGELAKEGKGVLAGEQRPVAPPRHPFGQGLDVGLEPDRDAALEDQRPGLGVHERAAAGRDHLRLAVDQPAKHAPLAVAEAGFAEAVEYLLYLVIGGALDLLVRIDEGKAEPPCQAPPDRRLAHAHQPDEDDRRSGDVRAWKRVGHGGRGYTGGRVVGQKAGHAYPTLAAPA